MTTKLNELLNELQEANTELHEATAVEREANRVRVSALNRVNDAQRMFDAEVLAIKKAADLNTDWRRGKGVTP